ncbi:MAG: hypothetical protein WD533_02140 [Dehalococcoidia bacterium]
MIDMLTAIDGSAWVAIGCWFTLWAVLVGTGIFLTQREKQQTK